MNDEARCPKSAAARALSGFGFRASFVFRHSSFVIPLLALGIAGFPLSAATLNRERWRWSNPLPHGNNVLDLLLVQETTVAVGDAGMVHRRIADGRWVPLWTGVTNHLRGAAAMENRLLVVGENGLILWSDDWQTFHRATVTPATTDWFEGVAASPQRAVAVGDNGTIYTSTTGTNWTRGTSGVANWLRGVAAGNGAFVAVGEDGTVLRSTTGTSWTKVNLGLSRHLNRVRAFLAQGASTFVFAGDGGTTYSSGNNGQSWTSLAAGVTNNLFDVAANDTGTLLVGDQEILFRPLGGATWTSQISGLPTNRAPVWTYLSASGASNAFTVAGRTGLTLLGERTNGAYAWFEQPPSSHAWLWDVTVQNGLYVAAGDLATILTSLDGLTWAREAVPLTATNTVLLGVGGTSNLLVAVGNRGQLLYSRAFLTNVTVTNVVGTNLLVTNTVANALGVFWNAAASGTTNTLQGIAASPSRLVVTGERGVILTSADGSNWVARPSPTTNFLSGVAAHPGGWVACGYRGTLLRAGPDATGWTTVSLATTNWLYKARWTGGRLLVVGQNGAIYSSADGTNWSARASGTTRTLNDVTFVDGVWYVAANQGFVLASPNLTNWTLFPTITAKSLFTAAAWEGQLVLPGIEGVVLRNQVVPRMTPVNFLGYHVSATNTPVVIGTNSVPGRLQYDLYLLGGEPDQFFQIESTTTLPGMTWQTNGAFEIYDPSGTLYLLRTRELTNALPAEFQRTQTLP